MAEQTSPTWLGQMSAPGGEVSPAAEASAAADTAGTAGGDALPGVAATTTPNTMFPPSPAKGQARRLVFDPVEFPVRVSCVDVLQKQSRLHTAVYTLRVVWLHGCTEERSL